MGVVPVGLTAYQPPGIRPVQKEQAVAVLKQLAVWQKRMLPKGSRFVFAADEFYLLAGQPFPPEESYEDYPQLENGIGLACQFLTEWKRLTIKRRCWPNKRTTIGSGVAGACVLAPMVDELRNLGAQVELVAVPNRFFGGGVTVTGLVTGHDLLQTLQSRPLGDELIIPAVMLRDRGECFLDDLTPNSLADQLGVRVRVIEPNPQALLTALSNEGG